MVLFFNCCFSLFAFEILYHKTETRNAVDIVRIKERQSLLQNGLKSPVYLLASYSMQQILFCFVFLFILSSGISSVRPNDWVTRQSNLFGVADRMAEKSFNKMIGKDRLKKLETNYSTDFNLAGWRENNCKI